MNADNIVFAFFALLGVAAFIVRLVSLFGMCSRATRKEMALKRRLVRRAIARRDAELSERGLF